MFRSFTASALLLVCFAALPSRAADDAAPKNAVFRGNMDALAGVLASLLPDALDRSPVDDKRARRLRIGIGALRGVAHNIGAMRAGDLPDADPSLGFIVKQLGDAANDEHSKPDRLPHMALEVVSTCIACHTRTHGPAARIELMPVDATLPADVRGDIFAATRRFDEARAAYRGVVFDEEFAARDPWRWERAVRRSLALDVRVADDAKAAAEIADQVLGTPAGEALYPAASAWKTQIAAWRNEVPGERPFSRASRLMNEALQGRGAVGDSSSEVLFLRATSTLHALLGDATATLTPLQRAQALGWLGVAYEDLSDLDVWGLFLAYDAACVDAAPHTPLARACLARYERASLELFSGNSGAGLPPDLQRRVDELRARAD